MKIVTLLSDILSTWILPIRYERIVRGDIVLHFYTITNNSYVYDGVIGQIGNNNVTKEEAIQHTIDGLTYYHVKEATIIFDVEISGFVWSAIRSDLPKLMPDYSRY